MNISQVNYPGLQRLGQLKMSQTTYTKKGKIQREAHPDVMVIDYDLSVTRDERRSNAGRVYWLVVDGEIVKIGGGDGNGGIDGTMSAYLGATKDSGRGPGSGMSDRSYSVSNFLKMSVKAGRNVEVYFKNLPQSQQPVHDSKGNIIEHTLVNCSFKSFERALVDEYKEETGDYPFLNTQEAKRKWSEMKHPDTGIILIEGHAGISKK